MREHLTRTGHDDMLETAELVVSEMVTNAIVHTGSEVELALSVDEAGLKVEVADSGSHLPMLASYDALSSTGRGLRLVDRLVDVWGVEPRKDGKVIWFRLRGRGSTPGAAAPAEQEPVTSREAPPSSTDVVDVVDVVLRAAPLHLHAEWQEHARALLREFLLVGRDEEAGHRIEAHAAAAGALALLRDQLPTPEPGDDEAQVGGEHHVLVPRECLDTFRTLDHQLEEALAEATAGRLLTPPTRPEFAAFRRWVCDEVERQAGGGRPRRWPGATTSTRGRGGTSRRTRAHTRSSRGARPAAAS